MNTHNQPKTDSVAVSKKLHLFTLVWFMNNMMVEFSHSFIHSLEEKKLAKLYLKVNVHENEMARDL